MNANDKQPPQLTHRMLEVFAAVVVHGGISAAARALDLSQPSVSRLIDDLQRATGLVLFTKRGRTIVPTAHAAALFSQVERSFIGLRAIAQHAQQLRLLQRGRLAVGCLPAMGHSLMPVAIARLRQHLPQTTVYLQIEGSLHVAQLVAALQVDIGFVASGTHAPSVQKVRGLTGRCCCILPAGHRLAALRRVSIAQLSSEPFIALSSHSRIRQQVEAGAAKAGVEIAVVAETRQSSSASDLVLRGVGIAVVDPFVAQEHVQRGGAAVPLAPPIHYDIDVIAHADNRLGEAALALLSEVALLAKEGA
jgi:DNA-binding transcriptional LysR family regulator